MNAALRASLSVLVSIALCLAARTPAAEASTADLEFHDCAFDAGIGGGECQHFLRNPAGVTDDPCWCDKCRNATSGGHHDGNTLPPGWNQTTFQTGTLDNYLKRHSVAWGITCSECYGSEKGWPEPRPPENDAAGRPAKDTVNARLEAEKRFFKKPDDVLLAYDKNFYVVTDITGLKVRMPGGTARLISKHEWLHLMIERAEFARREWVRNLGEPVSGRPVAVFFTDKERDCGKIEAEYFRSAGAKSLRGNGAEICGKMCLTGIAMSSDRTGGDKELYLLMRHQLAHNYVSLWGSNEIRPKSIPKWMDEGLAHWLSKTVDYLRDDATYCVGEAQVGGGGGSARPSAPGTGQPSWSGKGWDKEVARYVQSGKLCVIEELLAKSEMKHIEEEDHKRCWSYVDLCLSEWREPFVAMLRDLRQEKDVREAFQTNLGLRPEDFDQRWRDRVTGKRRSMAPGPGDDEDPAAPGARDRKAIRSEAVPKTLAALVRALGEIKDAKTIPVVVDVIAQASDLVRESALVTLLKTTDEDCRDAIWRYGLDHPDPIVRAYTARLCGRLGLRGSLTKLEGQLADKNWYARAESALACGMMADIKAMAGMRKIVESDPAEKAKIAATDALAMFHEDARTAVPVVAKLLDSGQWQLRIAAAQALGEMGLMEGVEPLVARLEKETGRVADELYEALKKISRDDLGRKPESWRNWWEREKANAPNGLPQRPAEAKKKPAVDPNDPHSTSAAPPPYFGVEIYSNRVAFVIDATETMLTLFTADPAGAKVLSREYTGRDKLTICKEEVAQALKALDPRSYFNVIAFGMQIRSYKPTPVPASQGNIDGAIGFMKSLPGQGRTNYYGAFKAVLDIGDEPDTNPNFRATPDTITFLTDGMPNEGDIIDADTLTEWYTGLNRYARVKTHTITFGLVGVDMPLLRNLAERNGGRFMIVPEAPLKSK